MAHTRSPRIRGLSAPAWLLCLSLLYTHQVSAADAILSWDPNPETDLGGYKVYYGTASGAYGAPLTVGNTTTSTVGGLGPGTYYFSVTAYNTSGNESGFSNEVSKTIADTSSDTTPPRITGVTVADLTTTSVLITWNTDEAATSQVEYGLTSAYGSSTAVSLTPILSHSQTVVGLWPDTVYFYRVRSMDGAGNTGVSDAAFTTAGAADTTPPGDVIGLTAKPHNRMVALSWTNPADLDFAGVVVRYRTDGTYPVTETDGSPVGDFPGLPNAVVKTNHTGLQNKVTYYYSVFTYDTTGNYSRTSHSFATPDEGLDGAVDAPSGGGGCGMIRPHDGNRPGPGQAADMVALLGLLLLRLAKRLVDRVRLARPASAMETSAA
ncbi:MAG: fibronectin type III domain-containing protein [Nitrospiria bacterium]